ncbi:MAG: thiamine ABC transporter substrate binding subunit [Halobacteriaceae archaeon]
MKRRTFIRTGAAGLAFGGLAGCAGDGGGEDTTTTTEDTTTTTTTDTTTTTATQPSGTLRIATYDSFVGEGAAGTWLKGQFESAYPEVTVTFDTPSKGLNEFIQRTRQGAPIDADLYVGLNTGELVTIDKKLDSSLFAQSRSALSHAASVKDRLRIDPDGRAIPYDTGYITLVYNADALESPPATFDDLLADQYEGDLITENAQQSDPGRAFLLWTIINKGADGYLDYWRTLVDNGVTVLEDWEPAYNAYMNGEAPMVVSYSTDQVYYHGEGVNMAKHQVGFLNDQGYANPEAMAAFADSDNLDTARAFMDFVLRPEIQAGVAERNVQFPAVTGVDMPTSFSKYAYEPPEPVTFTYKELSGNVETWIDDWAQVVVSG